MRVITVARKPFAGSVAQTALKYGTGGLNIDGCRIGYVSESDKASAIPGGMPTAKVGALAGRSQDSGRPRTQFTPSEQKGRWPANLILSSSEEVLKEFPDLPSSGQARGPGIANPRDANSIFIGKKGSPNNGMKFGDSGSAARFFKQVKVSPESFRAEGKTICPICGKAYVLHPDDVEEPYLTRLCDGTLVKL